MIDKATRGTLNTKIPEVAIELFKEMAMNSYQQHNFRAEGNKPIYVYDVDAVIALVMQLETLSKKIDRLVITKQQVLVLHCDLYGGSHGNQEC